MVAKNCIRLFPNKLSLKNIDYVLSVSKVQWDSLTPQVAKDFFILPPSNWLLLAEPTIM
jgi:hypothetical protein